ncbi:Ser/Arg-rich protein [Chelonid alphaherpesvirus 5]|uniref:Ser/Arg-rich protein n=1 Tax=Chelonid alphaherpesvirus 5 TaxID=702736 RepID=V5NWF8_9ALPH|nr:Ser/Arg-rich protein [Chelonid alphaherpesvirus 5]AHA93306.1 Ser/Arg-rich protein [Chelonid alphaherpesvirus 5]
MTTRPRQKSARANHRKLCGESSPDSAACSPSPAKRETSAYVRVALSPPRRCSPGGKSLKKMLSVPDQRPWEREGEWTAEERENGNRILRLRQLNDVLTLLTDHRQRLSEAGFLSGHEPFYPEAANMLLLIAAIAQKAIAVSPMTLVFYQEIFAQLGVTDECLMPVISWDIRDARKWAPQTFNFREFEGLLISLWHVIDRLSRCPAPVLEATRSCALCLAACRSYFWCLLPLTNFTLPGTLPFDDLGQDLRYSAGAGIKDMVTQKAQRSTDQEQTYYGDFRALLNLGRFPRRGEARLT